MMLKHHAIVSLMEIPALPRTQLPWQVLEGDLKPAVTQRTVAAAAPEPLVTGNNVQLAYGPRIALYPPRHVYADVAVELLGRVADSMAGHPWHVAVSLLDDGLMVFGLAEQELQLGLTAERATWRRAACRALQRFHLDESDQANNAAIDKFAVASLRAEHADLLLAAARKSARIDRRGEASQVVPGRGLTPDAPGVSYRLPTPRHGCEQTDFADGLDANGVDVDAAYERQVERMHDHRYGDGLVDR